MDFDLAIIGRAIIMVSAGFVLLRFIGRKSVSQMTIATTIVMISIGSIIVQPVADRGLFNTIVASAIFVAFLAMVEYLTMKFNPLEKLFTGKSKVIIQNGQIQEKTLKKLRLTVDKLEMQLRQMGIKQISDVKTATIEANGQLGYELMPDKEPLTVGEFRKILSQIGYNVPPQQPSNSTNLFNEIEQIEKDEPYPGRLH